MGSHRVGHNWGNLAAAAGYFLEKAMAPHCSTLAWQIPWMEEPGRLQSMGSLRVRHNWETSLWLSTFMRWRRKWQPTPVFLPGESQDSRAWWAAVYGVAQSWTRLRQLSSRIWRLWTWRLGSEWWGDWDVPTLLSEEIVRENISFETRGI